MSKDVACLEGSGGKPDSCAYSREIAGGSASLKATRKGAPHEVVPDALMGALLSSGKDSSSSLRKTKRSSITQFHSHLGGAKLLAAAAAADDMMAACRQQERRRPGAG